MKEGQVMPTKLDIPHMLDTTRRLTEVMGEEVELLKRMRLTEIPSLHDEKMRLTSILEVYKKMLIDNPDALKASGQRNVDLMRQRAEALERVTQEDEHYLMRARRVHKIIIGAITTAIEKGMSANAGYTREGRLDGGVGRKGAMPAISVSKNI